MKSEIKQFVATKAFIVFDGKVLILRESSKYSDGKNEGNYDLPGGRLNPGENFRDGLKREVKEETGLSIKIGKPIFVNEWRPVVRNEQLHIVGIFFTCEVDTDEVKLSDDHNDFKWIDPKEYKDSGIIENLNPVFEKYLE